MHIAMQIALLIMLTVTLVPILQYQAPADYAVCLSSIRSLHCYCGPYEMLDMILASITYIHTL